MRLQLVKTDIKENICNFNKHEEFNTTLNSLCLMSCLMRKIIFFMKQKRVCLFVCCSLTTAESVVNSFKVFLKTTENTLFFAQMLNVKLRVFPRLWLKRLRQLTMAYFNRHFKGKEPRVKWQWVTLFQASFQAQKKKWESLSAWFCDWSGPYEGPVSQSTAGTINWVERPPSHYLYNVH